jgi:8-amino-7-oxononanoate synthase
MERLASGRTRAIEPALGLDFTSNDYLGLRRDPRLEAAAARAAQACGWGTGASRLLGGTSPVHEALEAALAQWKGTPAALLFNTGFQCNATVIPALLREGDAVFSDALNHASIVDGCRAAKGIGAHVGVFRHGQVQDLARAMDQWRAEGGRGLALVVSDTVFSMDGDAADMEGLVDLCEARGALLMVDEAHATGLLGEDGSGLVEHLGLRGRVPLVMGTLGKALGAFGAYVACDGPVRDHLVDTCRGLIFSTSLPAPVAAAALEAVGIARSEPWRRIRALDHAARIRRAMGLPAAPSAIVPILVGAEEEAMARARALRDRGFHVRAVRPPSVPEGTSRLRITTGAHLEPAQVDTLLACLEARPWTS